MPSGGVMATSEWQYESAGLNSMPGRSGSLKKAYSESSSGDDEHKAETVPLFSSSSSNRKKSQGTITINRPSPVRSQISTTSDYHSDPQQTPMGVVPPSALLTADQIDNAKAEHNNTQQRKRVRYTSHP